MSCSVVGVSCLLQELGRVYFSNLIMRILVLQDDPDLQGPLLFLRRKLS